MVTDNGIIRKFATGATRNSAVDRYDYEGFLSPLVLERFAEYMHGHRKQADGSIRASDNWQKGIELDVYMKSEWRHHIDLWKLHRGYPVTSSDTNKPVDIEDALCALIFNIQGYLHEYLKAKAKMKEKKNDAS